jgi:hypothetical protein
MSAEARVLLVVLATGSTASLDAMTAAEVCRLAHGSVPGADGCMSHPAIKTAASDHTPPAPWPAGMLIELVSLSEPTRHRFCRNLSGYFGDTSEKQNAILRRLLEKLEPVEGA